MTPTPIQTVSLVILAKNEIHGMRAVMPRIRKDWVDEIVFIDGESTDGTFEYAQELGLSPVRQTIKGVIPGWVLGVELATSDAVITFSPDNNSIPELIPQVVAKLKEGYDMVVVSRYKDGARSADDSRTTRFGNWALTTMANVLFRADYTDLMVIFRGFRRNICSTLGITPWKSINTQLGIRCKKQHLRVCEIPGNEPARIGGESKRSLIGHGLAEVGTILYEFISHRGG